MIWQLYDIWQTGFIEREEVNKMIKLFNEMINVNTLRRHIKSYFQVFN